ncbi:MAG: hypothetical protein IRY87_05145 [Acetobacteraceae bacterium]|nr:hypothetical protein [Acetobacteraceae bacterium]
MSSIDPEEVKRVAAALGRHRLPHPMTPLRSPAVLHEQRKGRSLLTAWAEKAGLPLQHLNQLAARRQAEQRRLFSAQLAKQAIGLDQARADFAQGVAYQRKALDMLSLPFEPSFMVLDKPFLIWEMPRPEDMFGNVHYEALNSSVKISCDRKSGSDNTQFIFYFLWTNPSQAAAVINVSTSLTLNGFAEVMADTGIFSGHRNWLNLSAFLTLMRWSGWGTDPITNKSNDQTPFPYFQPSQYVQVANLEAHGGGLFSDPDIKVQSFDFQPFGLSASLIPVPAGATMLFQVTLQVQYGFSDGGDFDGVILDFASDRFDRRVICPLVALQLLTPQAKLQPAAA